MNILLTTLNARYIHTALGLRYLYANMGDLQSQTQLIEYTIDMRCIDIAEDLLQHDAKIIGIGVYIWNVHQCDELVAIIKRISPQTCIILGGPEVSFADDLPACAQWADFIIGGQADEVFSSTCREILRGQRPLSQFVQAPQPKLDTLAWPYEFYSEEDIRHRVIYVEASRGCPFKCEFCLSSLDKTAWPFAVEPFLRELEKLYQRGVRHFKFVDRTFNLKPDTCNKILQFFLQRIDDELLIHFELIPDHLPNSIKQTIKKFPAKCLQFEIGIQSFNSEVQTLISRRQDTQKTIENIQFLVHETAAHLHTDLIVGLPGEDMGSFMRAFDQLIGLQVHEIQVGILKRLRGTPIVRHDQSFQMRYNPKAPYNILSTMHMDFATTQQLSRFARYWDMIGNSGRFSQSLPHILADAPASRFLQLSDWLYRTTRQTHRIALLRLFELLYRGLQECFELQETLVREMLSSDFSKAGLKSLPSFMTGPRSEASRRKKTAKQRQNQHVR